MLLLLIVLKYHKDVQNQSTVRDVRDCSTATRPIHLQPFSYFWPTFLVSFFLIGMGGGGWSPIGSTRHCGHEWHTVPAPGDYDDKEIGGMIGRGNRSTRRKPAPVSLCPPQNPHGARTRTRAALVGSQRLTAWATARPSLCLYRWRFDCTHRTVSTNIFFYRVGTDVLCSEGFLLPLKKTYVREHVLQRLSRMQTISPYTKLYNDALFSIWNLRIVSDWRIFLLFHLPFTVSFLFAKIFIFKWSSKCQWQNWDVLIFH
jgi:hypothetical protein